LDGEAVGRAERILAAQHWEEVREHTLLQVEQYRIKREEEREQYTRSRYSTLSA